MKKSFSSFLVVAGACLAGSIGCTASESTTATSSQAEKPESESAAAKPTGDSRSGQTASVGPARATRASAAPAVSAARAASPTARASESGRSDTGNGMMAKPATEGASGAVGRVNPAVPIRGETGRVDNAAHLAGAAEGDG